MLKIRLQRIGARHEPAFRMVVTDKRTGPKSRKHLEVLGSLDARREQRLIVDDERVKYWLAQGAQPSDRVYNHLVDLGILTGSKKNVLPRKRPIKDESTEESSAETESSATETEAVADSEDGNQVADTGEVEESAPSVDEVEPVEETEKTEAAA